eukprot:gene238-442_t
MENSQSRSVHHKMNPHHVAIEASAAAVDRCDKFSLPVDTEHKATVMRPWFFDRPHMAAFHFRQVPLQFFAALLPIIREDLSLTRTDLGNAGAAALCGAIGARVLMGNLVAPAVYSIALCQTAAGFIFFRFFIGLSLAIFVACSFWCTSMFTTEVVGTANALAAGWGDVGGGFAGILMPLLFEGIVHHGTPEFLAWRWSFF